MEEMSIFTRGMDLWFNNNYKQAYALARQGADEGCEKCMFLKALCQTVGGKGVLRDEQEAEKTFKKYLKKFLSRAKKDKESALIVSLYYSRGLGMGRNIEEGHRYLLISAELGDPNAQWVLGTRYQNGYQVEKSFDTALEWYKKAAENGDPKSKSIVEALCPSSIEKEAKENTDKEKDELLPLAKAGNLDAILKLANLYYKDNNYLEAVKWYKKAAGQNSAYAMFVLGHIYCDCIGYKTKALYWFRKAGQLGDSLSLWDLGYMYNSGDGVTENEKKAVEYFKKSASLGCDIAKYSLGCAYINGTGIEKDAKKGFELIKEAANNGESNAQLRLANAYSDGEECIEKNIDKAIFWYKKAAELNSSTAQFCLGVLYCYSGEVEQDYHEAFKWFKKAFENGDAYSTPHLGFLYENGWGVFQNKLLAAYYYEIATELGESQGMCNLAECYIDGTGVEKDYQKAIDLLKKAYETDENVNALNALGEIYENGYGVEKDYAEAIKYYSLCEEKNDPIGIRKLGKMYENGYGVERDYKKAMDLYLKAIEFSAFSLGSSVAQMDIGSLYENGLGVDKDIDKALEWYKKSANHPTLHSGEAAYKAAFIYYDKKDYKNAKEYFEKAQDAGYNCGYALEMVNAELGINLSAKENLMRQYAEELILKKLPNDKLYDRIMKDIETEFGSCWSLAQKETKRFVVTGVLIYVSLYELGPEIYGNLDFSVSISQMFKALERELLEHLYSGYIRYLQEKKIDPKEFNINRKFLKRISKNEVEYKSPEDTSHFSLGSIDYIVGRERDTRSNNVQAWKIDNHMLEYLKTIFDWNRFNEGDIDREITHYIVSLCQDVNAMTDAYRNPASHSTVMKCAKAERCGNYLIKVQKLLIKFLEKIKRD